jgi:hypothetical protein
MSHKQTTPDTEKSTEERIDALCKEISEGWGGVEGIKRLISSEVGQRRYLRK